ncbi:hypothetical protein OC842_002025 [Tilletia horrida]|uniref:Uncharacterized protein n=1 Tax=Tilletia horrida TaxID=155126 RepID=A0AAN6JM07_9BASI|nr:hypothetical protein OC842_002025 [Tilletia horrida]
MAPRPFTSAPTMTSPARLILAAVAALLVSPARAQLEQNPRVPTPEGEISINIYGYTPSLALGLVCCIVFFIGLVLHIVWLVKYRSTRTFEALIVLACLMEIVGYAARIAASKNPFVLNSFVLQYFFIVISPIFLSAALYWALAVLIRARTEYRELSPIGPRLLIAIFVFFDVATILAQVVGAAFVGASESQLGRGEKPFISPDGANDIVTGGLAVQSAAFLVFLAILAVFLFRLYASGLVSAAPSSSAAGKHHSGSARYASAEESASSTVNGTPAAGPSSAAPGATRSQPKLSATLLWTLTGTALLIYMRTLFRLAESAAGLVSYIARDQALFGVFESMPIMLAVLWWGVLPLGRTTDIGPTKVDGGRQERSAEKA